MNRPKYFIEIVAIEVYHNIINGGAWMDAGPRISEAMHAISCKNKLSEDEYNSIYTEFKEKYAKLL